MIRNMPLVNNWEGLPKSILILCKTNYNKI